MNIGGIYVETAHRYRAFGWINLTGGHNRQWSGRILPARVPWKRLTTPRWLYLGPKVIQNFFGFKNSTFYVRWGDSFCVQTWGGGILNVWRSRSTFPHFPHFSAAERWSWLPGRHAEHGEMYIPDFTLQEAHQKSRCYPKRHETVSWRVKTAL